MAKKIELLCPVCKKIFYRTLSEIGKRKIEEIVCSYECRGKLRSISQIGCKNPNFKYAYNINIFKKLTKESAYLLGWISSDGTIQKKAITISIHKKDVEILKNLRNIVCESIPIKNVIGKDMVRFSIFSSEISRDVCKLLQIDVGKKSHVVRFPNLENELKSHFMRGYFDGDGNIHGINKKYRSPICSIWSNSYLMLGDIEKFSSNSVIHGHTIEWSGENCLSFLNKIYDDSDNLRLERKYNQYLKIKYWERSISHGRSIFKNKYFKWSKTNILSENPQIYNDTYFLSLIKNHKNHENLYDTCVKIIPNDEFEIIAIINDDILKKYGYASIKNTITIDDSYINSLMFQLVRMDNSKPDIDFPLCCIKLSIFRK